MPAIDAAKVREFLFDPNTPDYAFITEEEIAAAFGAADGTIRNWRSTKGFPSPMDVPGKKAYDVGSLRDWLKRLARESLSANRKNPLGGKNGGK